MIPKSQPGQYGRSCSATLRNHRTLLPLRKNGTSHTRLSLSPKGIGLPPQHFPTSCSPSNIYRPRRLHLIHGYERRRHEKYTTPYSCTPIHHSVSQSTNRRVVPNGERLTDRNDGSQPGFYPCLIRSALIKRTQTSDISSRKSMTVRFFIHTKSKRAEALALVDSGATENFMNLNYARYLRLPIQRLATPRKLYNVDGSSNRSGDLLYYTDLAV
jgi:hypothetical protein